MSSDSKEGGKERCLLAGEGKDDLCFGEGSVMCDRWGIDDFVQPRFCSACKKIHPAGLKQRTNQHSLDYVRRAIIDFFDKHLYQLEANKAEGKHLCITMQWKFASSGFIEKVHELLVPPKNEGEDVPYPETCEEQEKEESFCDRCLKLAENLPEFSEAYEKKEHKVIYYCALRDLDFEYETPFILQSLPFSLPTTCYRNKVSRKGEICSECFEYFQMLAWDPERQRIDDDYLRKILIVREKGRGFIQFSDRPNHRHSFQYEPRVGQPPTKNREETGR